MTKSSVHFPRWRGFNLLYMFTTKVNGKVDPSTDMRWIADWGFNFVRLPTHYHRWTSDSDEAIPDESKIIFIDQLIELTQKLNIHLSLNMHTVFGYCSNNLAQSPNLWTQSEPLDRFCHHWEFFAKRYRGISSKDLSFDLINEPPPIDSGIMTREDHERVITKAVNAIRAIDPDRLIVADGINFGSDPAPELAVLGIAQSCRGYQPLTVSHYKTTWVPIKEFPDPGWPMDYNGVTWNREQLERLYAPWIDLAQKGIGVHCGECGAFNMTPHDVFLAWFRDVLEILTENNIGFGLWNFDGPFGIMDSGRSDVVYEDFHGHKLDRKLLSLLQEF